MDQGHKDAPALMRRKRKTARQQREKTPDRKDTKKFSDEESGSTSEQQQINVSLEIRPPGMLLSHKSKILNRKNKSFTNAATRSLSAPRKVDNDNLMVDLSAARQMVRRSFSSPRQKEYNEFDKPVTDGDGDQHRKCHSADEENLTKLELNLRKFEEERKKFELEKMKFEKEKRDLTKLKYHRNYDVDDRKRILNTYKRLSDSDEKEKLIRNFKETQKNLTRNLNEQFPATNPVDIYYESSTASTSSDSETIQADIIIQNIINDQQQEIVVVDEETMSALPELIEEIQEKTIPISDQKISKLEVKKSNIFLKMFQNFFTKKKKLEKHENNMQKKIMNEKINYFQLIKLFFIESRTEWKRMLSTFDGQIDIMRAERNKCISHLIIMIILCGFGGLIFRFVEGSFENIYKCGVRGVKRDFIDHLWLSSFNMKEDDWKSSARMKLRKFEEELHAAHEAGMTSYSGMKSWNFINSVSYCMTIITTIGYGHIAPSTVVGKTVTVIYAIIGIPMFLILLADFGKLFTRGIKFLWVYVRRLYYTRSCRKVRRQQQVQDMMTGINMVYDIAIRRPSAFIRDIDLNEAGKSSAQNEPETPQSVGPHIPATSSLDTPTSPYPETYEIDDDFNLPISVATSILLLYIFIGASVYCIWENWSYFDSFYFVFISMSTIGFGDLVPTHPTFMMCSIVYLAFGLALTSMCINVVQVKLSDSFKHASAKLGATIGFSMAEEAQNSQNDTPVELASVHSGIKLDDIPETNTEENTNDSEIKNNNNINNSDDVPPPLLPRRSLTKPDIKYEIKKK